jgi:hypothetical protein
LSFPPPPPALTFEHPTPPPHLHHIDPYLPITKAPSIHDLTTNHPLEVSSLPPLPEPEVHYFTAVTTLAPRQIGSVVTPSIILKTILASHDPRDLPAVGTYGTVAPAVVAPVVPAQVVLPGPTVVTPAPFLDEATSQVRAPLVLDLFPSANKDKKDAALATPPALPVSPAQPSRYHYKVVGGAVPLPPALPPLAPSPAPPPTPVLFPFDARDAVPFEAPLRHVEINHLPPPNVPYVSASQIELKAIFDASRTTRTKLPPRYDHPPVLPHPPPVHPHPHPPLPSHKHHHHHHHHHAKPVPVFHSVPAAQLEALPARNVIPLRPDIIVHTTPAPVEVSSLPPVTFVSTPAPLEVSSLPPIFLQPTPAPVVVHSTPVPVEVSSLPPAILHSTPAPAILHTTPAPVEVSSLPPPVHHHPHDNDHHHHHVKPTLGPVNRPLPPLEPLSGVTVTPKGPEYVPTTVRLTGSSLIGFPVYRTVPVDLDALDAALADEAVPRVAKDVDPEEEKEE